MLPLSGVLKPCLSWYQLKESCTVPLKPDTWRRYWCSSPSTLHTHSQWAKTTQCILQLLIAWVFTWSCGRGHVCAGCSSPPGQCEGCNLPGWSGHGCGCCPTRTLCASHQIHPCNPSSCGQSSLSHQLGVGSRSSHHLKAKKRKRCIKSWNNHRRLH